MGEVRLLIEYTLKPHFLTTTTKLKERLLLRFSSYSWVTGLKVEKIDLDNKKIVISVKGRRFVISKTEFYLHLVHEFIYDENNVPLCEIELDKITITS